jgi:hypothetical protein
MKLFDFVLARNGIHVGFQVHPRALPGGFYAGV